MATTPAMQAAMQAALRRAAGCEGLTAQSALPNLGAALFGPGLDRPLARGSDQRDPAWARVLSAGGGARPGATLCLTALTGDTAGLPGALAAAGVVRLVVAAPRRADGRPGRPRLVGQLERRGVKVVWGVPRLEDRAAALHRRWWHFVRTGRPWVTLKAAISLDGKVAMKSGHSQWITGEAARREAHRLRARHGGIAVGLGTLLADDPRLDVRLARGRDPHPVVFDSRLRSLEGVDGSGRGGEFRALRPGTIVLHRRDVAAGRRELARQRALEPVVVRTRRAGGLDVHDALAKLGEGGVSSLMVEGGGRLLASFVAAELYEELWLFVAPRLLGGEAQSLLPGLDWGRVERGVQLEVRSRRALGPDQLWVCARAGSPS